MCLSSHHMTSDMQNEPEKQSYCPRNQPGRWGQLGNFQKYHNHAALHMVPLSNEVNMLTVTALTLTMTS